MSSSLQKKNIPKKSSQSPNPINNSNNKSLPNKSLSNNNEQKLPHFNISESSFLKTMEQLQLLLMPNLILRGRTLQQFLLQTKEK